MEKVKGFLKKKDIVFSVKRYGIDALGAMAQGLFCTLLIGTILNTLGNQFGVPFLKAVVATVNGTDYTVGGLASAMAGPAMAVAIGYALKAPQLVLFSLITVGFAANALGGAGGPLAVYFIAVIATELGKVVSKETKIDILVTPLVTIGSGVAVSALLAPTLGAIAMKVGDLIMLATNLQPFWMGIAVSVLVGVALTLPISSAAICAAFGLTGLAGGAAVAVTGPLATCLFKLQMNGTPVSSGMGTCGLVGQIGVYTGWMNDIEAGTKSAVTAMDWVGLILISFVLPAVLCPLINMVVRKLGWVKDGDMTLS